MPVVRQRGICDYGRTLAEMQAFTANRDAATVDEIWVVEHSPVFTQGLAGKPEHVLNAGPIPVVASDRGGQVTYHGPGQIIIYALLDLHRYALGARGTVLMLEQIVIDLLAGYEIAALRRTGAPGVYVGNAKVAALGLRIRRGCCYHGIAVNVDVDLTPFNRINPCGYAGLAVTSLRELGLSLTVAQAARQLVDLLQSALAARRLPETTAGG